MMGSLTRHIGRTGSITFCSLTLSHQVCSANAQCWSGVCFKGACFTYRRNEETCDGLAKQVGVVYVHTI